jgi:POT family proton-dependent oligopeptide transporter
MSNGSVAAGEKQFFGHPRGLATLFFTEMWERFSYYGMRALLILFMTDSAHHGLGMGESRAGAIYGLYTFGVYALALLGGWIADRLVGQRRAVLHGGILIALGHYCLAVPSVSFFYVGLLLIVLGTGLLKPNVSAIVGDLYEEKGPRRDAGFSIFYMGINVGAFLGPLACSWLGEPRDGAGWVNWHYGFGAAGVGMTLALVQYVLGQKYLKGAGELKGDNARPEKVADAKRTFLRAGIISLVVITILVYLSYSGIIGLTLETFAGLTGIIVSVLSLTYFVVIIAFVCKDSIERRRVALCAMLFIGAAMFWSGFEQAGSSMSLFARDHTNRVLLGMEIPAGVMQAINPIFIILMAPVMGMLWVWLGKRNPSIPVKFGAGLVLLGAGFMVLAWGANYVDPGRVGIQWLVVTYFLHTVGELCLSPIGLSSVTKLAPDRLVGQMMGTWFMGAALGNLVAGLVTGYIETMSLPDIFGTVALIVIISGAVFLVLYKPINWLAAGIK